MKVYELARTIGKSNTDTKLLLQDLGINYDGDIVADETAQKIIDQATAIKEQSAPAINGNKPAKQPEPTQDNALNASRAINYQVNSESEQAILEGASVRGSTLANLASAIEANSFINQLSTNKAEFANLYLATINQELSSLLQQTEGKLMAPVSPLEQLKNLQLNYSQTTQRLQPSNWLKSNPN